MNKQISKFLIKLIKFIKYTAEIMICCFNLGNEFSVFWKHSKPPILIMYNSFYAFNSTSFLF